jgi:Tol biopolymer transport system component
VWAWLPAALFLLSVWPDPAAAKAFLCSISQLTDSTGFKFGPVISGDGGHIAFPASSNIIGSNPDLNTELFLIDMSTMTVTQITHTTGAGNVSPTLNGDGSRLALSINQRSNGR